MADAYLAGSQHYLYRAGGLPCLSTGSGLVEGQGCLFHEPCPLNINDFPAAARFCKSYRSASFRHQSLR